MSVPLRDALRDYAAQTEPPDALVTQAVSRVMDEVQSPGPGRGWWIGGGALALLLGALAWWGSALSPSPPVPPQPLALSSPEAVSSVALAEGVDADLRGEGEAVAAGGRLTVRWQVGQLTLRAPDAHQTIEVITGEGRLSTEHGTLFVERSALGSRFEVRAGAGMLRCEGAPAVSIEAGAGDLCLPTTAAGWRARALALSKAGASPTEVLDALDAGLARVEAADPLQAELEAARVQPLLDLGRAQDALEAAERYLAGPPRPRTQALRRVAASIALRHGDCARALGHLQALEAPTEDERRWIEVCAAEGP